VLVEVEWQTEPVPTYEYAVVFRERNWATISKQPEIDRPPPKWTTTWSVWEPNATKAEEQPEDTQQVTLFNKLGQAGWKLVASAIPGSAIARGHGLDEVSVAVSQSWTFLRES
jgi:hypothetical protein